MSRPQHVESMFFLTVLLLHLVRTGGLDFPCRNAVFCAGAIRGRNGGRGRGEASLANVLTNLALSRKLQSRYGARNLLQSGSGIK